MNDSQKEMRALLASQGELVGSICHDLKGLLTGVEGGLYLVDSGVQKGRPERIAKGSEMLKRNLSRMRRTVANILYYVKDRELEWSRLDLRRLVQSVREALSGRAEELGVELRTEAENAWFEGDEHAIHSLLANLVEYSLEALDPATQGRSRSVVLSATSRNGRVEFEISANGFRMGEDARASTLADFYAPKGADRSHLGVFVARTIARAHLGTLEIAVASEQSVTKFAVALPQSKLSP